MDDKKKLKAKIIASIRDKFSKRFRVIDNTSGASRSFNGVFPDVILMQSYPPENDNIFFLMKIEEDYSSDLLDSATIWKMMSDMPFFSYIIVPKEREAEARKIIKAMELKVKTATFTKDHTGKVSVKYE